VIVALIPEPRTTLCGSAPPHAPKLAFDNRAVQWVSDKLAPTGSRPGLAQQDQIDDALG